MQGDPEEYKGGFPLSRNFTSVNKMEAMYRKPHADVKVAPGSTVTFTRPSIHYLCFIYASKVYVRTRVQNYSTEEICPKTIEIA